LQKLALVPTGGAEEIDKAIDKLQALAKKQPDKPDNWIVLGRAFVQKARQSADPGFYANADACANIALDLKPSYTLALSLRGLVMMNDHRFKDALELANSVLATDQDDLMALSVKSDAQLELGDVDGAAVTSQKMLDLKPNLPSYARASYLQWIYGDVDQAKKSIRLAMDAGQGQRDPEPGAWVTTEAAKIFFHAGDYEGARAGFDRALSSFPDYAPALLGKARVELALGNFASSADLAKRSYEKARLAEASWVWGDAERSAGNTEKAAHAYAETVKIGRQGDKRTLAAFFAVENRDLEEALALVTKELKSRGDLYTHDAHAWVLYRLGRFQEAKTAIEQATKHGTKDPSLTYHHGAILLALGETEMGLAKIKAALAMSPGFHRGAVAEAKLLLAEHGARAAK
jgi:tetratricopeptide (TPR) repeat protein